MGYQRRHAQHSAGVLAARRLGFCGAFKRGDPFFQCIDPCGQYIVFIDGIGKNLTSRADADIEIVLGWIGR